MLLQGHTAVLLLLLPCVQMRVSPYSCARLHAAQHEFELPAAEPAAAPAPGPRPSSSRPGAHVVLDCAHMGVGGDDSWSPSVAPEFLVGVGLHACSLALMPAQLLHA